MAGIVIVASDCDPGAAADFASAHGATATYFGIPDLYRPCVTTDYLPLHIAVPVEQWARPQYSFTAVKTSACTASPNEVVNVDPTGGAFTVTLPAGAEGGEVRLKNVGTSTNVVTVDGNGSQTIDGATTYAFSGARFSAHLIWDNVRGEWCVF